MSASKVQAATDVRDDARAVLRRYEVRRRFVVGAWTASAMLIIGGGVLGGWGVAVGARTGGLAAALILTTRDRLRFLAQLNRNDEPRFATGGKIRGSTYSDGTSPARVSEGYVIVHGHTAGVDHDGPVVVQGDDWAPLARDERPEWMTEASWDRLAGQGRPLCAEAAPGFTVGFGHPAPVSCIRHSGHGAPHRAMNGAEW